MLLSENGYLDPFFLRKLLAVIDSSIPNTLLT